MKKTLALLLVVMTVAALFISCECGPKGPKTIVFKLEEVEIASLDLNADPFKSMKKWDDLGGSLIGGKYWVASFEGNMIITDFITHDSYSLTIDGNKVLETTSFKPCTVVCTLRK